MEEKKEIVHVQTVIIGGGWNGIGVGASLASNGVKDFVILERGKHPAWFWAEQYDRLSLHSPNHELWNSPSEWRKEFPFFKKKQDVIQYLKKYAQYFHLDKHFRFETNVVKISHVGKTSTDSFQWSIETENHTTYLCKILAVCTSMNRIGRVPDVKDLNVFKNTFMHSSAFKNAADYKDKKVLIIGAGNSACEIGLDCVLHGAKLDICVRGSQHFINVSTLRKFFTVAEWLGLGATKHNLQQRFYYTAADQQYHDELKAGDMLLRWFCKDLTKYGIPKPEMGPMTRSFYQAHIPSYDWGLIPHIESGKVGIIPSSIEKFTETVVTFTNGVSKHYDVVISATGYYHGLDLLFEKPLYEKLFTSNLPKLYPPEAKLNFVIPSTDGRGHSIVIDTLYFGGFNAGTFGGLTWGISSWFIGESIAIQLGTISEQDRTILATPQPSRALLLSTYFHS